MKRLLTLSAVCVLVIAGFSFAAKDEDVVERRIVSVAELSGEDGGSFTIAKDQFMVVRIAAGNASGSSVDVSISSNVLKQTRHSQVLAVTEDGPAIGAAGDEFEFSVDKKGDVTVTLTINGPVSGDKTTKKFRIKVN